MILFDPDPPYLRWWMNDGRSSSADHCLFNDDWPRRVDQSILDPAAADWVGYLLYNGGNQVTAAVSSLTPTALAGVRTTIPLLPEHYCWQKLRGAEATLRSRYSR